jgi:hypothetical protein
MTDIVHAYQSVSRFSVYPQEFLIILLRPIKASGIPNIRVGVVIKQTMKYELKLGPLVYKAQSVAKQ